MMGEGAVEAVEVLLAVHAERAGDLVEAVERALVQAERERAGQRVGLLRAHLHASIAQLVEEIDEHLKDLLVK